MPNSTSGRTFALQLAREQQAARQQRLQAADDATEEYLLGRLEALKRPGYQAMTAEQMAALYGVTPGMIHHRVFLLRRACEQELETAEPDQALALLLGKLLDGVAQMRNQQKKGTTEP